MPTTAYSYIRFSSKPQEEGDSVRRQTEGTTSYAKRKKYKNLLPLGLLANDLQPVLSRLYSRQRRFTSGILVVLVGAAIPVVLLAVGGGVAIASAVLVALGAALGVRNVIVRLPHLVTAT